MIAKAVVIWWVLTLAIMMWRSSEKKDKTFSIFILKSLSISALFSGAILVVVMLLNNISGV